MAGEEAHFSGWIEGVGKVQLFWQEWMPAGEATGIVILCHGAGEHSGRYSHVVETLTPDGWAVYGLDQRGHGRSGGTKVHVERFDDWLDDLNKVRLQAASRHPDVPVFVLGHSLGGQIALAYTLGHQDVLSGVVLSAPLLAVYVPTAKKVLGRVAARVAPSFRPNFANLDLISQDPEVVRQYRNDPLVYQGNSTLAFAAAVERQMRELPQLAKDLRLPILVQYGSEDQIADHSGTIALMKECGSSNQTVWRYPGLWHEIYNEPERHRPLTDLREWLSEQRAHWYENHFRPPAAD